MGMPLYVISCFSLAAFNIFSLNLIFVSLINMCLVYVSIQLVCVFLLEYNPFTFKVIIDMYVPITIFLIVLGLFL